MPTAPHLTLTPPGVPQGPDAPPPPALELGPLPQLQDSVAVVGYPIGEPQGRAAGVRPLVSGLPLVPEAPRA